MQTHANIFFPELDAIKDYGSWVGWVAELVKLVELRVKELEVQGSIPSKEKN
jgi:hypothetical protein